MQRRNPRKRWWPPIVTTRIFLYAVISGIASACSHIVVVEAPGVVPIVEQIPAKIAVAYDDGLRNHRCKASKGYIADEWLLAVGAPSIAMFDSAFSAMFAEVIPVDPDGKLKGPQDGILARVSLQRFSGCDVRWPIIGQPIEIGFSADILRGSDVVLDAWSGTGAATAEDLLIPSAKQRQMDTSDYLGRLTTLAIRRAVAEFVWKFEEDQRILAWKASAFQPGRSD